MRHQDWPARLHEFIESRRDRPFEWGSNDCVTFAAGAIEAMTGQDLIGEPRWDSAATAVRLLKEIGGMESVADVRFSRVPVNEAQRGDIGLVVADEREFLGVIYPPYVITPGEKQIVMNPLDACRVAWMVDR